MSEDCSQNSVCVAALDTSRIVIQLFRLLILSAYRRIMLETILDEIKHK